MSAFGIFWQVIFPIFFIILVGALLERALTLDISTLTRINFYAFVPALVFVKMLQADLALLTMGSIALFVLLHSALLFGLALLIYRHPLFAPYRKVLLLASMLTNAGNYGIPFVLLAFGDRYASVSAVIFLVQNLMTFTFGILLMESGQAQRAHILRSITRLPVIYALVGALALDAFSVKLPSPLAIPLDYMANALVPVALLTLGTQLGRGIGRPSVALLAIPVALRLVVAPLLALVLLPLFGLSADIGKVLVATAGLPIAVNVFILSAQYRTQETFASQVVTVSTLLSALTQSVWLTLLR
ncbi:MAG: AEC family transporter [Chthonomonadetes bacterium]|nr:AEC family transporter [Chthonomonadetes bacterium]